MSCGGRSAPRAVQIWDDGTRARENYSTLAGKSVGSGREPVVKMAELHPEQRVQQNNSTRGPQASVSAALSAARAGESARTAGVRFPAEDGGRSLAEMAQRDLDAALQLLADRAQYITGASGAAIALRRTGKNDMLCRASAGENAPELGALLSTEFGLSGESVRTRQPLRCDDAERDARVNRDVCRQMGIASVVVMPVVNDDEVLGVFELFSGKANAFGVRDVSAVQRLSEMVETAVRLAQATESLPERLKMRRLRLQWRRRPMFSKIRTSRGRSWKTLYWKIQFWKSPCWKRRHLRCELRSKRRHKAQPVR